MVAAAVPAKTKQATDFRWSLFETFYLEKSITADVDTITAEALANVLKKYGGRTKKKGGTQPPAICPPERPYSGN